MLLQHIPVSSPFWFLVLHFSFWFSILVLVLHFGFWLKFLGFCFSHFIIDFWFLAHGFRFFGFWFLVFSS